MVSEDNPLTPFVSYFHKSKLNSRLHKLCRKVISYDSYVLSQNHIRFIQLMSESVFRVLAINQVQIHDRNHLRDRTEVQTSTESVLGHYFAFLPIFGHCHWPTIFHDFRILPRSNSQLLSTVQLCH